MEASQNRSFYGKVKCLSLWPTSIGQKGRTLGKTYGIKVSCYWEHPWGTLWELIGNLMGTCCEQGENEKMELHTNIRHLFFGAWVYVMAGWAIWKLALMHIH
jgi:hypothetical protein